MSVGPHSLLAGSPLPPQARVIDPFADRPDVVEVPADKAGLPPHRGVGQRDTKPIVRPAAIGRVEEEAVLHPLGIGASDTPSRVALPSHRADAVAVSDNGHPVSVGRGIQPPRRSSTRDDTPNAKDAKQAADTVSPLNITLRIARFNSSVASAADSCQSSHVVSRGYRDAGATGGDRSGIRSHQPAHPVAPALRPDRAPDATLGDAPAVSSDQPSNPSRTAQDLTGNCAADDLPVVLSSQHADLTVHRADI